jgi:large repetitive protein
MGTHRALGALLLMFAACGDNLHPGGGDLLVSPRTSLYTDETGFSATFMVSLSNDPLDPVGVRIDSTDEREGTISPAHLTFSANDGEVAQLVTITGIDDDVADGDQAYVVHVGVGRQDTVDLEVVNGDDDAAGVDVRPLVGLHTSEVGSQAAFTVALKSEPVAGVFIPISSADPTEGTTSTTMLEFTPSNWNKPQTVSVIGVDDGVVDGAVTYAIVLGPIGSADLGYRMFDPDDVQVTNADDDVALGTPAVVVTPTAGLVTSEAATTAMFTIRLNSQPTASVTIAVSSSDLTEATVSPPTLTFTTANWQTPQPVTVTGVDDGIVDGPQMYQIIVANPVTTDLAYAAINPTDVNATNNDNDTVSSAGFTIDPTELTVSEFADADQFSIQLTTMPTGNVTVNLSSSDTTEGTVLPPSVTFTPANWNVAQFVAVTGVNDAQADGNITFSIITAPATSTDTAYNNLNPADVSVTNIDNDGAQVFVKSKPRLNVNENGQTATFQVSLTVAPTATVTCPLQVSDTTEASLSATSLMFQPANFGFQTVTVTGLDDLIVDGDQNFVVVLGACTSTDPAYNNANPRDVNGLNRDND